VTNTRTAPIRLPGAGRLLLAQIRYQALLLAGGRAVVIGVGLPVLLLIASNTRYAHPGAPQVAAYAVFGLTLTAWNTYGVRLVAAREAGVLKRWRATPLPRWCYFLGRVTATVIVAGLAGAATIIVGVLLYHTRLSTEAALGALAALVLGGFAWAATATALTAAIPTVEAAAPTLMLTYFPAVIISGVFGSISEPHWLYTIATYLPAQPLIGAVTSSLRHAAGTPLLPARDVITLAVWAVAGLAAAIRLFRWEPRRPGQRRAPRPDTTAFPVPGSRVPAEAGPDVAGVHRRAARQAPPEPALPEADRPS
jgi:ABC-2 type transport system permease protein